MKIEEKNKKKNKKTKSMTVLRSTLSDKPPRAPPIRSDPGEVAAGVVPVHRAHQLGHLEFIFCIYHIYIYIFYIYILYLSYIHLN